MGQLFALYNFSEERELERMKFLATLLGAEIKEEAGDSSPAHRKSDRAPKPETSFTMFKHQSEYSHLPAEERQRLTERMKSAHQQAMRSMPKQMGKG